MELLRAPQGILMLWALRAPAAITTLKIQRKRVMTILTGMITTLSFLGFFPQSPNHPIFLTRHFEKLKDIGLLFRDKYIVYVLNEMNSVNL